MEIIHRSRISRQVTGRARRQNSSTARALCFAISCHRPSRFVRASCHILHIRCWPDKTLNRLTAHFTPAGFARYSQFSNRRFAMRKLVFCLAILGAVFPTAAQRADDDRHVAGHMRELSGDDAGPVSHFLRLDERLVQSQMGLRLGWPERFCEERRERQAMVHHLTLSRASWLALERSFPQPAPVTGQIKIDMSLVTCRQYLTLMPSGRK